MVRSQCKSYKGAFINKTALTTKAHSGTSSPWEVQTRKNHSSSPARTIWQLSKILFQNENENGLGMWISAKVFLLSEDVLSWASPRFSDSPRQWETADAAGARLVWRCFQDIIEQILIANSWCPDFYSLSAIPIAQLEFCLWLLKILKCVRKGIKRETHSRYFCWNSGCFIVERKLKSWSNFLFLIC